MGGTGAAPGLEHRLHAGFASRQLHPDPGAGPLELSGYAARTQPATGVRDPLQVDALAMATEAAPPLLLVALDLCAADAALVSALTAACPLDAGRVQIVCSHTHSAPAGYHLLGCGRPHPAYLRHLVDTAAATARAALDALAPCRLGWGQAVVDPLWANRRDPAGVVDPRLRALKIERTDDLRTPVCLVWSAPCHPVVLEATERRISADWVGVVRARLPYPSLFVPGCCGDQNPRRRGEAALADWTWVADRLHALWGATATAETGALAAAAAELDLPRRPGDDPTQAGGPRPPGWEAVALPGRPVPPTAIQACAWRMGNGRLLLWPGEPHAALAQGLPADCLATGHAGASCGYIPERAAYAAGGYEVASAHRYYGFASALAPEAGEMLRRVGGSLLDAVGGAPRVAP